MNLDRFGFTPTEARLYQALLRLGPGTGYLLAREVGIARANAYQALDGLVRRGAARKSATMPAQYHALPPETLLAALERGFRRDLAELEGSLSSLPRVAGGAVGIASLDTAPALLAAAIQVAESARSELLAVTGPWATDFTPPCEAARNRNVQVKVLSLGEPPPMGAFLRPVAEPDLREYWGGLPLAAVADRATAVCGIVLDEGLASGVAGSHGLAPFIRHLLRREFVGAAPPVAEVTR